MKLVVAFLNIVLCVLAFSYYLTIKDAILSRKGEDSFVDEGVNVMISFINLSLAGILVALGFAIYCILSFLRIV